MKFVPGVYLGVLKERDFAVLITTVFLGQLATGFLIISEVSSVFLQTKNNFSIAGIVLSLAVPGFFFIGLAGVVADLFDRRKIIIFANFLLTVVILLMLFLLEHAIILIILSFAYFGVNSFFIPAVSAASAQLVKKRQLLVANSLFISTLYGGVILGSFLAGIANFFVGHTATLVISEVLLVLAVVVPFYLPKLEPHLRRGVSIRQESANVFRGFIYTFKFRAVWFFFLIFSLTQGVIAFGTTLTPGFFDEVIGLSIKESPLFIFPLVGFGLALGAVFAYRIKIKESILCAFGIGLIGFSAFLLGLTFISNLFRYGLEIAFVAFFIVISGFGIALPMIASRTVLQKKVAHMFQGTAFGANVILATVFAGVFSLIAAVLELFIGYVNILVFGGLAFFMTACAVGYFGKKWKF